MAKIRIGRVEAIPLCIPFDHWAPYPLFAGQPRTTIDTVLVRLEASNGVIGWGQIYAGGWQSAVAALDHSVAPLVLGQEVSDVTLQARIERILQNLGRSGPVVHAISGVDIALWDIRGKLAGEPVHALLGEARRKHVQAYASLLQYGGSVAHIRQNTARALQRGYRQIKLHERTPETVQAAREVAGPDVPIMVDTNCAWLPHDATAAVMAMAPSKLMWIEEPIWPPEDFASLAVLRRATGVPTATGENASNENDFRNMIAAGAVDYVQPSATKIGLTALWRICKEAEAAGVTCAPHAPYFGPGFLATLHVLASMQRESALERFFCDLAQTPYETTVPVLDGSVQVPEGPGLGADPEPQLMRFRA